MPTYLITGANRGIGHELARRLLDRGERIVAAVRRPETAAQLRDAGARVEQVDAGDEQSMLELARRLEGEPVDVLINNAGVQRPDMTLDRVEAEGVVDSFRINTLGPLLLTRALLPNLRAGERKLVVNVSTNLASLARTGTDDPPGWYAYRASKAALNMITRCLAAELGGDNFTCVALHPGWVRTDMGGENAPLGVAESGAGIVSVIDGLKREDNGRYLDWRGEGMPW